MNNICAENIQGFQNAGDVTIPEIFNHRITFGNTVLDKIFGGGILPGSSFTIDGCKGSGKTTFLLQCGQVLSELNLKAGHISGEECKEQVAYTCRRLGVKDVLLASYNKVSDVCEAIRTSDLDWCIVDSWQRLVDDEGKSLRTEQAQKEAIARIVQAGKDSNCVVGVILQRTKTGKAKGASEIQHTVDANYQIELDDQMPETHRHISSDKNRFGVLSEQILEMGGHGYLFDAVTDDSDTGVLKQAFAPGANAAIRGMKAAADKDKIQECVDNSNTGLVMSKLHKQAGMSYQKCTELCTLMLNEGRLQFDGKKWTSVPKQTFSIPTPEAE